MRLRLFALLTLITVAGCGGNKVTQDNFKKIKDDMTYSEVEAILGPGTQSDNSILTGGTLQKIHPDGKVTHVKVDRVMEWRDRKRDTRGEFFYVVMFADNKVVGTTEYEKLK